MVESKGGFRAIGRRKWLQSLIIGGSLAAVGGAVAWVRSGGYSLDPAVRDKLAKSVVAARDIPAGAVVHAEMLTVKGPGDGIPANHLARLVGRVAAVDVAADTLLPKDALEWTPSASVPI